MRAIAQTQNWYKRMLVLLLVMAGLVLAVTSVRAADLPTSENPAAAKWSKMKPSSFTASISSILEQCNRAAEVSKSDRLTLNMCQKMAPMIAGKKCPVVMVPDGIVFDYMNGQINGRSGVALNVEKAIGRQDRALLCDLGNRTYAYWFTGHKDGKGNEMSCNNVGIAFVAKPKSAAPLSPITTPPGFKSPPPVTSTTVPPQREVKTAEPAPEKTCGWVLAGTSTGATQVIELQGQILDSCLGPRLIPGQTLFIQGGATVTYVWSCK